MTDQDMPKEQVVMSRRALVRTVGLGAVVLAGTHAGVAYEATQWAQAPLESQNKDLKAEVERLRGLVKLYEGLDKVGVDAVVSAGLGTVRGLLDATRNGLVTLSSGVDLAEKLLNGFAKSFGALRDGLRLVEGVVATVAQLLADVQKFLGTVTSPIKPLALQLRDLFGSIPLVGDSIRQTFDSIISLISELPNLVLMLNTQLLEPLRSTWLSDQTGQNFQGALIDPIVKNVLDPARAQLKSFDQLLAKWETDFRAPVQTTLDQRATIRNQIIEYRKQNNMSS